jgi:hypothetical protein
MDSQLMERRKRKKPASDYSFTAKPERAKHAQDEPKGFIGPGGHLDVTPKWEDIQIHIITC